jgi:RNA-directed DNA polymerase
MFTRSQTRWSILLPRSRANSQIVSALARTFLSAESDLESVVTRANEALGRRWRWLRPVARRFVKEFGGRTRPRVREAERFLLSDPGFQRALAKHGAELKVVVPVVLEPQMRPIATAKNWKIPTILIEHNLAVWLRVSESELAWFATLKSNQAKRTDGRLQHYHYRVLTKTDGSARLIEAPKERLKSMQRKILSEILERVPVHPNVHGFVKRRSIKTFAEPHTGKHVVLRMDLKDFFPTVSRAQVQAFFRTAGYPERVADLLGGLCTNAAPLSVWKGIDARAKPLAAFEAHQLYGRPHLPQGAPTSPALANLCMYRADCRLSGLAKAAGAIYTRYADDLAFSGGADFEKGVDRFAAHVAAILHEQGFGVNHRKTRVMRRGVRQILAGVVTNEHANIVRAEFDRLKAILTNCVRHRPETQNRDGRPEFRSHLEGRVSFVEMINSQKGARLRRIFERIEWE